MKKVLLITLTVLLCSGVSILTTLYMEGNVRLECGKLKIESFKKDLIIDSLKKEITSKDSMIKLIPSYIPKDEVMRKYWEFNK